MASVNLNALAEVQTVGSNQNMLLFGDNNVATRIDYDKLAEAILNKTRDEIGGVSPISAIAALNSRLMSYGFISNNYLTITTTNYNGFYFPILLIIDTTIAIIRVNGTSEPTITAINGSSITSLSVETISNGIRINYNGTSVRGGVIVFAPLNTVRQLAIKETQK